MINLEDEIVRIEQHLTRIPEDSPIAALYAEHLASLKRLKRSQDNASKVDLKDRARELLEVLPVDYVGTGTSRGADLAEKQAVDAVIDFAQDIREEAAKVADALARSYRASAMKRSGEHQQQHLDWARGAEQVAMDIRSL